MLCRTRLAFSVILFCALGMAPSLTLPLAAHEIGTTRVSVNALDRSRFDIEVVTDAGSLLEKLETIAGEPPSGTTDTSALQQKLDALGPIFQQRVIVSFDGTRVQPALRWTVSPPATTGGASNATLRLTGDVPVGAQALTWKYSWTFTVYALVDRRTQEAATTEWLEGDRASTPMSLQAAVPAQSRLTLLGRYVVLGFTHILPKGLDHVLFVLGIFLLSQRVRPILLQVTAFTVAHSITLALSIYGLVSLPASIVEPAIALSIAYIAIENVVVKDLRPWRYAVVFAFGLLHGLGFAGVLQEVGLPPSQFLTALLGFNVGVELGQLTVIGAAFLLVGFWFRDRTWYRARIVLPASVVIACAGLYWTLERLNFIA
ncbi:MAG: HupE/UreJ family protein [Acidobacteriota bacterium]|nr:HupE/UreJ family protein [Acidobacteriota bacterium]